MIVVSCISNKLIRKLRREKDGKAIKNVKRKELNEMIVRNDLCKLNVKAEGKIWKDNPDRPHNYASLPVGIFKKPLKAELKAFVHVRTKDNDDMRSHKNKGSVDGPMENNLVRAAYTVRCLPVIMMRPDTDEDGNVIMEDDDDDVVDDDVDVNNEDPPRLIVECPPQCPPQCPPRNIPII